DGQPFHGIQADRRHHRERVRRHGPRPFDQQEVRRDARRGHRGGERAGSRLDVRLRDSAASGRREGGMSGRKILYVEDNEANRMIVRDLLKRTTYQLIEAYDGEAGVAKAIEAHPDLILMDLQLPKTSG